MKFFKKDITIIAILFLLNFFIKLINLDKNDIAIDEPFSIYHAQMGIGEIISALTRGNNPPLFEIILHYWIKIVGINPFQVRLLPFIFSCMAVIFVFLIGRRFYSRQTAIFAALFYSFSNFQIFIAHNVRVYSLFFLFSCISLYLFLSIQKSPEKGYKYFFLGLVNLLIIYCHYFGFFVLLIETIAVIVFSELRKKILRPYLITIGIVLTLYIPMFQILIKRFFETVNSPIWISKPSFNSIYNLFWSLSNAPVTVVIIAVFLLVTILFWYIKNKVEKIETPTKILLLWLLFPVIFSFIVSFYIPIFLEQYLVYASLAFYLLLAVAINYFRIFRRSSVLIGFIILIAMLVPFNSNYGYVRDWISVVNKIKEERTSKSIVVIYPSWLDLAFCYHYDKKIFQNYLTTQNNLEKENIFPVLQLGEIDSVKVKSADKIFFIDENGAISPDEELIKFFKKNFSIVIETNSKPGPLMYIYSN